MIYKVAKLIPYRKLILSSALSVENITSILTLVTERANKNFIDFSKINEFEGIIDNNSFVLSKGPLSLTIGKMSAIPVFVGSLSSNIDGTSNIVVVVRLNYTGFFFIMCAICFFIFAFILTYAKYGLIQSIPNVIMIVVIYFSIIREFNKTIKSFLLLLHKSLILK